MKKFLLFFLLTNILGFVSTAQDFSNKGKDFWIPYPEHIDGTQSTMGLYITSDVNTSGTITVGANAIPFTVTANSVTPRFIGLTAPVINTNVNVYLGGFQDNVVSGKGIHVVSALPVVVFAHIIRSARSGATLVLPSAVWGKEYIMPSYANTSSNPTTSNSYAQIDVFAEKANTLIEITPAIITRNGLHAAGVPFQITLPNIGDIYQLQFPINQDPSGTIIKSIASGTSGCNKIGVFASTTWSSIGCTNASGGDNLYQQLFPSGAWGKNFMTAPLKKVATSSTDNNTDIIRVFVKDPSTIVTKMDNGLTTTLTGLSAGNFYEYVAFRPTYIVADKPVQVVQYIRSQSCGNPVTNSDPEMIAVSALEQTINDITVFSAYQANVPAGQSAVTTHYLNVIMKTANTGSFKINGYAPSASFTPITGTAFSFLKENVTSPISPRPPGPVFRLQADSGFNAIAYGFGNVESYGYNAGTNVRDFNQQLFTPSQYGIINDGNSYACLNTPFKFNIYLPDSSLSNSGATAGSNVLVRYDSMKWNVTSATSFVPNNFPVTVIGSVAYPPTYTNPIVTADSVNIRNGKPVAWYSIPTNYAITTPGTYTITVTGYRTNNNDGCASGNETEFVFTLVVPPAPTATFTNSLPGCPAEPVQFTETNPQTPYSNATYLFTWNFGDPASGAANTSTARNPVHTYSSPGTYTVTFSNITTAGCISATTQNDVIVPALVSATLTGTTALCQNAPQPNLNFTITGGLPPYKINYTLSTNGGAALAQAPIITSTLLNPFPVPTTTAGTYTYNITGVENANAAFCTNPITGQTATVTVNPLPTATISGTTAVCQGTTAPLITFTGANGLAPYIFTYNINGGANQTVTTTTGNSVTVPAPTTTIGTYTYTLVSVQDASSTACTNAATGNAVVTVQATSTATISGNASVCQDATAPVITFTAANGTAPFTFEYNINGGATQTLVTAAASNSATVTVPMTTPGTFVYNLMSVKNTGPTTCLTPIINQVATVVINPNPTATIAGSTIVCQNTGTQNITFTGAGGTAPYTFTYNINGGANQTVTTTTGNSVTVSVSSAAVGTFIYTMTQVQDASVNTQCIRTYSTGNSATVQVQATSTATISGNASVCQDATAPVITFTAANGIAPFTFEYNINGGATQTLVTGAASNSATITVPMTATGTFVYNLTSVKNTGPTTCLTPITNQVATVVINPNPTATIAGSTIVCQNTGTQNITFTGAGGTAPYTFTYNINGGANQTVTTTTGNSVTVSVSSATVGTYVYTMTQVQDASVNTQCVRTYSTGNTATVQIQATSTATISGTTSVCQDATAPLITFTGANGIAPFTFTYNINGGATQTISTTAASNSVTLPVSMALTGTFIYNLLSVKNTGPILCLTPITGANATVTIRPVPTATIAGTATVCQNSTSPNITFTGANATAPYTFTYTINGGAAQTVTTTTGNSVTVPVPTTIAGTYVYALTQVQEPTGCIKNYTNTTATVIVRQLATATIATNAATVCQASTTAPLITFTATGGVAPYTFAYTLNGAPLTVTTTVGNSVTVAVPTATPGTFTYNLVSVQESSVVACTNNQAGTATVIVHPKPTASFFTTGPFCEFKSVLITPAFGITPTGSVTSWVWDYGDGTGPQIRTNGNPFTLTYPTAGVKIITFKTISDNGCVSDVFTPTPPVTIFSKPKAGFVNPAACLADALAQFTDTSTVAGAGASIVFWEWDFGDGSPIFAGTGPTYQNPTHAYAAVGQKSVTLIVTTNSGCKDTTTQQFFINGEVTRAAFTTLNAANLCSNRPVQIRENSIVNVGGLIRTDIYWDYLGAPILFDQDNTPTPNKIYTHNYPNLQIDKLYKVRYYAYSGFNGVCQKDTLIDVLVHASPVAVFTTVPDVCLNGGPVTLTQGTATGGTAVYTGPGVTFSGGIYTFNPLATGVPLGTSITVVYTVTSTSGCDSARPQLVKVLAPPVVNTFTTVGNLCHNNAITFQNTYTNGDGTVVRWIYNWNDGSPLQIMTTGADVTHVYTTTGPHTATLTLETGYGCRNIPFPTQQFIVNPLPVPSYNPSTSVCLPSANVLFTNTTPGSNTYQWSFDLPSTAPANTSTTPSPTHTYTSQGPFNTQLIATNIATGCIGTSAIQVINSNIIHPAPVLQFNNIPDVCLNNGTVPFAGLASEVPGTPAIPGSGMFTCTLTPLAISTNGIFNPLISGVGTHTITYTWTSNFNCPTSINKTVKVLAPPVVNSFTTIGNRCENNAITFQNTVTQGAGTINTWVYDFGDGQNTTATNGNDITHVYAAAGTYNATLTLITTDGCRSAPAFPLQVIVNPLPVPNFTFSDTACLPQAKVLFNNTTANFNDWVYFWNFDLPSTLATDLSTQPQPGSHTYFTQSPHNVQLIAVSSLTGCRDTIVKPITTIHPAPTASFNFNKASVCLGQNVSVLDNSTFADGGPLKWSWNFGESSSNQLGQSQPAYTYATVNTFNVKLAVTNSFGCVDDTVRSFRVYPYPTVNAGPDSYVLEGGTFPMAATASGNTLTYLWTSIPSPTYLSSNVILNPLAKPVVDITYKLSVTAEGGCTKADSVFIKVLKFPEIPNTFTPNNDGVHDFWEIKYLFTYPGNKVQVFTRTGQKVFESNGYTKPWDGNMNGKSLPFDTYYYIIEPGSGRKPITGYVTIVK